MSGFRLACTALLAATAVLASVPPAGADMPSPCYHERDHVRCFGHPFEIEHPPPQRVEPPRDLGAPGAAPLDMTGKPRFAPRRGLGGDRADRYNPLPDRDGGYFYPGARAPAGSPLYGHYPGHLGDSTVPGRR